MDARGRPDLVCPSPLRIGCVPDVRRVREICTHVKPGMTRRRGAAEYFSPARATTMPRALRSAEEVVGKFQRVDQGVDLGAGVVHPE